LFGHAGAYLQAIDVVDEPFPFFSIVVKLERLLLRHLIV